MGHSICSHNVMIHKSDSIKSTSAQIELALFEFSEAGLKYVYTPALNIYGYGRTATQARASFDITVKQFLNYTIKKGTFKTELNKLGWEVSTSKKNPKLIAPKIEKMLVDNEEFSDILRNKNLKKYSTTIEVPVFS